MTNTASLTGMVMLLVGTASVLSWIFAAQGIPPELRVRLDAPSEANAASKVVLTLARSAS